MWKTLYIICNSDIDDDDDVVDSWAPEILIWAVMLSVWLMSMYSCLDWTNVKLAGQPVGVCCPNANSKPRWCSHMTEFCNPTVCCAGCVVDSGAFCVLFSASFHRFPFFLTLIFYICIFRMMCSSASGWFPLTAVFPGELACVQTQMYRPPARPPPPAKPD